MGPSISLPLRTPDRILGALTLIRAEGEPTFSADARDLALSFAAQAAVTLMLAEARRERERLVVFEDRDRIGRDLHDLVIQRLFATGMSLQGAMRSPHLDPDVSQRISRAVDELDATVKEIRQTIFHLHASDEGQTGLRNRVLAEARAIEGVRPNVHFTGAVDSLTTPELEDHVIAVCRELLSNAARHAQATRIDVLITASEQLAVSVSDDGIGVPTDVINGHRKSGLLNIAERAEHLGGSLEVIARDHGSTIVWSVPLA
jgi:signal transduction histidine kinase